MKLKLRLLGSEDGNVTTLKEVYQGYVWYPVYTTNAGLVFGSVVEKVIDYTKRPYLGIFKRITYKRL